MISMDFKSMVELLPVGWQNALSSALGYYITRQDPEKVEFEKVKNGYVIKVETDDESAEEAKEFWQNHVHDKL